MSVRRRVVVSGIGMVSPLGLDTISSWTRLLNGESGLSMMKPEDDFKGISSQVCGCIPNFDPTTIEGIDLRRTARFTQLAIKASDEALKSAKLDDIEQSYDSTQVGTAIGSGIGSVQEIGEAYQTLTTRGPRRVSPLFVPRILLNMAGGNVALRHKLRGPNHCPSTACATGAHAIGEAFRTIERGDADVMLAGATEASIDPLSVAGFAQLRALSTAFNQTPELASRPFDKRRDGFVIAEGCAILVLEEREAALRRGANVICEINGFGMSCDAHHLTAPSPTGDGAFRAMNACLSASGIPLGAVKYVNAHATSTPLGDEIEGQAIERLFEDHPVFVSSTKGATGHLLGAAGAVEAAFTALSIQSGRMPVTRNLEEPSDSFKWSHVKPQDSPMDISAALCNSFGFGGTNASLLFSKHSP